MLSTASTLAVTPTRASCRLSMPREQANPVEINLTEGTPVCAADGWAAGAAGDGAAAAEDADCAASAGGVKVGAFVFSHACRHIPVVADRAMA